MTKQNSKGDEKDILTHNYINASCCMLDDFSASRG